MLRVVPPSPASTTLPRGSEPPGDAPRADADVVDAARRGDHAAWETLYLRYARIVHAVLLARVPAPEAEDLVHDVFATAMRSIGSLRDGEHLGAWLGAVARNRATDFLRRRHRRRAVLNALGVQRPRDVHRAPANDLSADEVLVTIARLPEAYKETLIMRLVEGLTGPQIAERTGMTHGSVRVNLSRGMELLRAALSPEQQP